MSDPKKETDIDLGSAPADEFDPFADDLELDDDFAEEINLEAPAEETDEESTEPATPPPASKPTKTAAVAATKPNDNPMEAIIDEAETKEAEKARQSIYEKLPVFDFAGALEDIEDSSQTFDELRIAKAADFPELEDGKRVSWTVEYCKITKTINGEKEAKGMTIGKMKSDIETSKAFLDALKKSKDKSPVCKIKPRVTAQSKGNNASYKGVFTNMEAAAAANKVISIVPAKDGKVYEVRNTSMGKFTTPVIGCELLSDVQAGFSPAFGIPLIPMNLMIRIISFFRYYVLNGNDNEVLVNIYWDTKHREFLVDTPAQVVSKVSVDSSENPDYQSDRFIHYMDIHSHNSMKAYFSAIDDADEKATRLYTVIGRLDQYLPEVKTRISNGGKFLEIDPREVFEYIGMPFPDEWKEKVSFRTPHKDFGQGDADNPCKNMGGGFL